MFFLWYSIWPWLDLELGENLWKQWNQSGELPDIRNPLNFQIFPPQLSIDIGLSKKSSQTFRYSHRSFQLISLCQRNPFNFQIFQRQLSIDIALSASESALWMEQAALYNKLANLGYVVEEKYLKTFLLFIWIFNRQERDSKQGRHKLNLRNLSPSHNWALKYPCCWKNENYVIDSLSKEKTQNKF